MRKIIVVVAMGMFAAGLGFGEEESRVAKVFGEFHKIERKNEADVIVNSVNEAAKGALSLKGLRNAKRVGVLIVRETSTKEESFGVSGMRMNFWDIVQNYFPILNLLRKKEFTLWSRANLSQGETEISHSPLIEELVINELVNSGRFETVETLPIQPYTGISDKNPSLTGINADVLILGSAGGSIMRRAKRVLYLWEDEVFACQVKLTLRTVDVKTGQVTSSDVFTGTDSVVVAEKTRIPEILSTIIGSYVLLKIIL